MPSRFDPDTIREYFEYCARAGLKRINSISALVSHTHQTGNNDAEIKAWLFPEDDAPTVTCPQCNGTGRIPEPKPLPTPGASCPLCFGTGMEVMQGKGARRCACLNSVEERQ